MRQRCFRSDDNTFILQTIKVYHWLHELGVKPRIRLLNKNYSAKYLLKVNLTECSVVKNVGLTGRLAREFHLFSPIFPYF
ncbi:hypothetical protein YERSI8AC_170094 [Enterobacterales bacterium 8AC]|jgi:hypothetical protein|nr:hypothetical protein YERSI8AC_170094 [Enterobacterales bacterium 8AC]